MQPVPSVAHPEETFKPDVEIVLTCEGASATKDVEHVLIGDGACANSAFVKQFSGKEEEEERHGNELVELLIDD